MFSSNFTVFSEDLIFYPIINIIYKNVIHTTFIISSIMFPLMLYVIITKSSKQMEMLKRLLCTQALFSYLFDVSLSTFLPVPLFPFYLGYGLSPISELIGSLSGHYQLEFIVAMSVGMCHSMAVAALYRVSKLVHGSFFTLAFEDKLIGNSISLLTFIVCQVGVVSPLVLARVSREEVKARVIEKASFMEGFFNETPTVFGYETSQGYSHWVNLFIIELILLVIAGCTGLTVINFVCLRLIRVRAKTLQKKTVKLHMMLYKALTVQMIVGALLLVIPTGIASLSAYLGFKYANPVIMICVMIASSHAIIEYLFIMPLSIIMKTEPGPSALVSRFSKSETVNHKVSPSRRITKVNIELKF